MKYLMLFVVSTVLILHLSLSASYALPPALIPKTGQATCYDATGATITCAGTGQDGDIQAGVEWPNPRFVDNGDQTMIDKLTGLIWTKDANLLKTRDPSFDIDNTQQDGMVTWQHALDYIAKLNNDGYLGVRDWRLPNINELTSLFNRGVGNNASWLNGLGYLNVQSDSYWSSTTIEYNSGTKCAWIANMLDGSTEDFTRDGNLCKEMDRYVWPVRKNSQDGISLLSKTGQTKCYNKNGTEIACSGTRQDGEIQEGVAWPSPRFIDNGDETITDYLTGLIWTKDANIPGPLVCDPVTQRTWLEAFDYIKCLNYNAFLGKSDWRLPNINELSTLSNMSTDTFYWLMSNGFSNLQFATYWSSSTSAGSASNAFTIGTNNGSTIATYSKPTKLYMSIWPVRTGTNIQTWLISSSSNAGGSITPQGNSTIPNGSNREFSIDAASGYTITDLKIDGVSQALITVYPLTHTGYSFTNITGNHTISATFSQISPPVNGACGSSSGGIFSIAPSSNFCTFGTATAVTGTGPWSWSCIGTGGGATASCSASLTTPQVSQFIVTPTIGSGFTFEPATPQTVNIGGNTSFTVIPVSGYGIATVSGCSGNLNGTIYTTSSITANCSISVTAVARNASSGTSPALNDALKVLQAVVGTTPLTAVEKVRYDVAPLGSSGTPLGNGTIDSADVILILRRSIGIGSW